MTVADEVERSHTVRPADTVDGEVLAVGRGAVVAEAARRLIERGTTPASALKLGVARR